MVAPGPRIPAPPGEWHEKRNVIKWTDPTFAYPEIVDEDLLKTWCAYSKTYFSHMPPADRTWRLFRELAKRIEATIAGGLREETCKLRWVARRVDGMWEEYCKSEGNLN